MYNINKTMLILSVNCVDICNTLFWYKKIPGNYYVITDWLFHPFVDILSTIYWNMWDLIPSTYFKI